jgi:lipopolysaccharide/colanic/teichoic acid biosynthesis glycosyltransferase
MILRSLFDRVAAALGLVALAPVLVAVGIAVVIEDGWPWWFAQERIGRSGRPFRLLKFRSMRRANSGSLITARGDSRITRVGAVIRKYKLDELPQLWNVLKGEMDLIGPRPEVARYVEMNDPLWRGVLQVRPGITDLATLVYRNEEEILAQAEDPEQYYRQVVLPEKLRLNLEYQEKRSLLRDLRLIFLTLRYSFLPGDFDRQRIRQAVLGS